MAHKEMSCCDAERHTYRDAEEKKKLLHRLSRLEGQIRGLRRMMEEDAYCVDVLTQSAAVGAALDAFNRELMGHHIRGCVTQDIRQGNTDAAEELIGILHRLMR